MKRRTAPLSILSSLALLALSFPAYAFAGRALTPEAVAAECEGAACPSVAVSFDEAKEQYRVLNNSADRWVKVAASNVAAYASVCVGPGKAEHLPLKSIAGAFRADYAADGCAPPGE